jgi:hypothetical protein
LNAPENRQLAVAQPAAFDLSPRNFEQALTLADYLAASDMVPKQYRGRPGDCLIAMQWGMEIGLKPLQALQSIAPINGKPNLYGDAGKALLLANGCIIDEDDMAVVKANGRGRCKIVRPGRPPVERTFSVDDAKTAKLWGKEGPWTAYPYRQIAWRAFWFAARDAASDLLRGMGGFEEGIDTPTERHMGPAEEVKPAEKPALPAYPQADFDTNLPKWQKLIDDGKGTAQALLTKLSTKAVFTEEQKARILSLKPKATEAKPAQEQEQSTAQQATGEHDEFIRQMEGGDEGGAQ